MLRNIGTKSAVSTSAAVAAAAAASTTAGGGSSRDRSRMGHVRRGNCDISGGRFTPPATNNRKVSGSKINGVANTPVFSPASALPGGVKKNSTISLLGNTGVGAAGAPSGLGGYKGNNIISANKLRHLGSVIMPFSCINHPHQHGQGEGRSFLIFFFLVWVFLKLNLSK